MSTSIDGGTRRFVAATSDRLDRVIAEAFPEISRTRARRLIEDGAVRLADAVATHASQLTNPGDEVMVTIPEAGPNLDAASAAPLDILYEDEHTLVINKVPDTVDAEDLRAQMDVAYGAPTAAVLPLSTQVVINASGALFSLTHPDHPWSQGIRGIAERLQDGSTTG